MTLRRHSPLSRCQIAISNIFEINVNVSDKFRMRCRGNLWRIYFWNRISYDFRTIFNIYVIYLIFNGISGHTDIKSNLEINSLK